MSPNRGETSQTARGGQARVAAVVRGVHSGLGGRRWLAGFTALLVASMLGDVAVGPTRSLLPVYAEAVLLRAPEFTSMMLAAQLFFSGIAALTGGALVDALGNKRVLLLGSTGLPLLGLVFLLRSPALVILLWVYAGFATNLGGVGRQTYVMAVVPPRFLATATAVNFTALTLGGALGNLAAGPIVDGPGFGAMGAGAMVVAGAAVFLTGVIVPEVKSEQVRVGSRQAFSGYSEVLQRPGMMLLTFMRLFATAYWAVATFLFPLLIYRVAGVASAAAYYGTASLVFASASQLAAGRVLDHLGCGRPTVILTAMLGAIGVVTTFFTHSLVGLYVCGVLGAGIAWGLATATPSLIAQLTPQDEHGRAMGLTQVATSLGMLSGTLLGGWLVDANSGLPFLIVGLVNLAAVLLTLRLQAPLEARRRDPATGSAR